MARRKCRTFIHVKRRTREQILWDKRNEQKNREMLREAERQKKLAEQVAQERLVQISRQSREQATSSNEVEASASNAVEERSNSATEHQDNLENEFVSLIKFVKKEKITFNKKKFYFRTRIICVKL